MKFKIKIINQIVALVFILFTFAGYAQSSDTVSIVGVGDIMLGTNFPSKDYLPPNQGRDLLAAVNFTLNDADITFGNLEGTILDKGATIKTGCKNCYAFRMPEFLADNLVTAGFDFLSIANNHIRDFGSSGINNTIRVLTENGIEAAGVLSRKTATLTRNGVSFGLAAFAPNIGTVQITDIVNAKKIVRELAKTNDIVIVSFHGGAEGVKHQRVPQKTEYYYGENRGNVHKFAHAVIDAGADIVFGHGPHVTRAVEVYQDRFIAYSLGNFCTYGRFNLRGAKGIAPIIKVYVTTNGRFKKAEVTSIKQIGKGIVRVDFGDQALNKIQSLTRTDGFADNIDISNNGWITPK